MSTFDGAESLTNVGTETEESHIFQFFIGSVFLTTLIGLIILIAITAFTPLGIAFWPYLVLSVLGLAGGGLFTLFAIKRDSPHVFVPQLRITPDDTIRIFQSNEPVNETDHEYHVIVPADTPEGSLRYSGLGRSPDDIRIFSVTSHNQDILTVDSDDFNELNHTIAITEIDI